MRRVIAMLIGTAISFSGCGPGAGPDASGTDALPTDAQGQLDSAIAGDSASAADSPGVEDALTSSDPGWPVIGAVDGSVSTALPMLPPLTNVTATLREDSVGIDFDPVDGAADYRVYVLPADGDIAANPDGTLTIRNAIYRCAGLRETWDLSNDLNAGDQTLYTYGGPVTIGNNPNMGYVYVSPAAGRIPVYALAGHQSDDELGWREARLKIYTTDPAERQQLLSQAWRDDGVVFYVPAGPSSGTHTVFRSQTQSGGTTPSYSQYYFLAADMNMHTSDTIPASDAFEVLDAAGPDTQPLFAVFYQRSHSHTELSAGSERFQRSGYQGNGPLWHLEWAGITQPVTLVVEALGSGCPFQGFISPQHLAQAGHQVWYTLSDLQATSPTGEVFVNGEHDTSTFPQAIARSFIQVAPQPVQSGEWDWYESFHAGTDLGTATMVPGCLEGGGPGYNCTHAQTADLDISAYRLEILSSGPTFAYGALSGQLWEAFDDSGQDVTGKVRIGALEMGAISSDPNQYFHATMSVNIVSTDRRYPQLILSDQPPPVQEGMYNPNSNNLIIQPIGAQGESIRLEAQAFHGQIGSQAWDVNNQAPANVLITNSFMWETGGNYPPSPVEPVLEHAGVDRMTRFDVYMSSQRAYVFMDGTPAGCFEYPSGVTFSGPVSLTMGDVLYHELAPDPVCDVAESRLFSFLHEHQCIETERHFDDVGFKSNVAAPVWNEQIMPCVAYSTTGH